PRASRSGRRRRPPAHHLPSDPAQGAACSLARVTAPPTFDLQSHSRHSDGELPSGDVVRAAAAAGVELFALTDHDTVDGVDEALAAALRHGVRLTPATELSAVQEDAVDVHILGYEVDHRDISFLERLASFRADRDLR